MSDKPTLHEIAAMPFPASMLAMRKHYNPDWHTDPPEGDRGIDRKWKVWITFEQRSQDEELIEVEAGSQDEAEELAMAKFEQSHDADDLILEAVAEEVPA